MTTQDLGRAGLQRWRGKVADTAGPLVARRTPFSEDQVKAAIGVAFLVLSALYLARAIKEWVSQP